MSYGRRPLDFPSTFASSCSIAISSCIHPAYKGRFDLKYVKRFSETHLSWVQYKQIKDAIVDAGFLSMCTPWDETSVDGIAEHGYDFIKLPSCYLTDWPILEKIAGYDLPMAASTAGAALEEIDKVVSFFGHRSKRLALMHCVGEYPSPDAHLHLSQIALLKGVIPPLRSGIRRMNGQTTSKQSKSRSHSGPPGPEACCGGDGEVLC